jgi:hypothetical protein
MMASQRSLENLGAEDLALVEVQVASEATLQSTASRSAAGEAVQPDDLELLRSLVAAPDRARLARLEAELAALDVRTSDRDALVAAITPILSEVISHKIQDSREEMVTALYPIIGQLIGRAVTEAIRDLVRSIDARMRTSFTPQAIARRLRARILGIPKSELLLRDALPFQVTEIFLIERESGLLLQYLARDPASGADSDLVSGMLTAIRDFAQDTFGRGTEDQLDEIQYGSRSILIEASRHAYLAVVMVGIEPAGFRADVRYRIMAFENAYGAALARYDGDASRFAPFKPVLSKLLSDPPADDPKRIHGAAPSIAVPSRQRIIRLLVVLLLVCLLMLVIGAIVATPIQSMVGLPH